MSYQKPVIQVKRDIYTRQQMRAMQLQLGKMWAMNTIGYSPEQIADNLGKSAEQVRYELKKVERSLNRYKYPSIAAEDILEYDAFITMDISVEELERGISALTRESLVQERDLKKNG